MFIRQHCWFGLSILFCEFFVILRTMGIIGTCYEKGTRGESIDIVCICRMLRDTQSAEICVMSRPSHCLSEVCNGASLTRRLMLLADFWRLRISQFPKPHTKTNNFPAVPFYNTKTDIPTLNNGLYPFSSHELFVYLSQKLYYSTLQK